jgi:uncharacterized protein with WD repeat
LSSSKNTNRSKRKYGENRRVRTVQNKTTKKAAADRRAERLIARTQNLIGKTVEIRTKEGPLVGKVREIVRPPKGAKRKSGQHLVVADRNRTATRSRHRAKVV